MKITVLMENTAASSEIHAEHGLSLYIETAGHKILFDAGQTDAFAGNAKKLGIDLEAVDIAVLSHGHYDHSGGFLRFLELNKKASVYMNKRAFESYYSGTEEYIGLDQRLKGNERIVFTEDTLKIDEELELFSCNDRERKYETNPFGLNKMTDDILVPDDFLHEQYLLIHEAGKRVLISGCSHKGILNIVEWFKPDVLVGGFHFMKLDREGDGKEALLQAAEILSQRQTVYYTGHCTGVEQYEFLKEKMGEKLHYISSGTYLEI